MIYFFVLNIFKKELKNYRVHDCTCSLNFTDVSKFFVNSIWQIKISIYPYMNHLNKFTSLYRLSLIILFEAMLKWMKTMVIFNTPSSNYTTMNNPDTFNMVIENKTRSENYNKNGINLIKTRSLHLLPKIAYTLVNL